MTNPEYICFACAKLYGNTEHTDDLTTIYLGECDICKQNEAISHIRNFGMLNDVWFKLLQTGGGCCE